MTLPIQVAQIGIAHPHASGKMQALRQSSDFEVVGVSETNRQLREMVSNDPVYEGLSWKTEEELLHDERIEAIAIETDVPRLLDVAEACIAAGKHIHLDKPAGFSLSRFQNIVDAAAKKHLVIQLGYMYRNHPGVKLLDRLREEGWLGEIFAVNGIIGKRLNAGSRKHLLSQPGGIMFELGGHMLDLIVHLLGRPHQFHTINQHSSEIDDGYLDNMLAVLGYPESHATLHCSCNDVAGFARRQLVVCGTEGTLEIRPMPNPSAKLALTTERGEFQKGWQDVNLPRFQRYHEDITDFAKWIRHEEDPRFSFEHDLIVQETLLKISGLASN